MPAPETSAWSQAIADRPYNLDAGMLELHGAMPVSGVGGDTEVLLGVGAAYGISDLLEVGGDYAFQLSPTTDAAGILAGHIRLRLVHDEQMSAALGASALYSHSLYSDGIALGFAGVAFRYRLSQQFSIYTDTNVCGGCVNVAGPVVGQFVIMHISDSNNSETLVAFTIPIGLALQVNPQLYLYGGTVAGAVLLSPKTDSYFILSDTIPIVAGAWFSPNRGLDLGISITDDLKNASDNYFVEPRSRPC